MNFNLKLFPNPFLYFQNIFWASYENIKKAYPLDHPNHFEHNLITDSKNQTKLEV